MRSTELSRYYVARLESVCLERRMADGVGAGGQSKRSRGQMRIQFNCMWGLALKFWRHKTDSTWNNTTLKCVTEGLKERWSKGAKKRRATSDKRQALQCEWLSGNFSLGLSGPKGCLSRPSVNYCQRQSRAESPLTHRAHSTTPGRFSTVVPCAEQPSAG